MSGAAPCPRTKVTDSEYTDLVSKAASIASGALKRRWRHLTLDREDFAQEATLRALNGSLGKPSDGSDPSLAWMVGRMISRLNRWATEYGRDPTAMNCSYLDHGSKVYDDTSQGVVDYSQDRRMDNNEALFDPRSDHEAVADLTDLVNTRCPEYAAEIGLLAAGHTQAEAAQELGISTAAFEKRIARARKALNA